MKGDALTRLVEATGRSLRSGWYDVPGERACAPPLSLRDAVEDPERLPLVLEVKPRSPSGAVSPHAVERVIEAYGDVRPPPVGISILTAREGFGGSLDTLRLARERLPETPLLMKDIIVDGRQIRAGWCEGADAVLLIHRVFRRGLASMDLKDAASLAHGLGMEVVLETCGEREYRTSLHRDDIDILAVNNRDLTTLEVEVRRCIRLLDRFGRPERMPFLAMSGYAAAEDIIDVLSRGADAVLLGSLLMSSMDLQGSLDVLARCVLNGVR